MESKFTGTMIEYWAHIIAFWVVTCITFGIAYPWMVCMKESWIKRNTIVNGKQLEFRGSGTELFGHYIVWLILTCITLGIYGLWLMIKLQQWKTKNTFMKQ